MGCISSKYIPGSTSFQDENREKCVQLLSDNKFHIVNLGPKAPTPNADFRATDDANPDLLEFIAEKGQICLKLPDKEHGEGFEPLKIPTAFEFTAVGSLREWLNDGGEVTCLTPKFDSYSSEMKNEKGCFFNPELVAAIEEHMQQLELEEEIILNRIAEKLEARSG